MLQKARDYSFLLLKFRPRSEKEIYERLKKKKFDLQIIKETISFLRDRGLIDDNYFARVWIESRIKKPLGLRRLREELRIKGIAWQIIDNQINEIKKDYPEEIIVANLTKERLQKIKGIDSQKAKRRIFSYLVRRGFSPDVVMDVVNELLPIGR